jgi:hypothetical protein
MVHCNAHMHYVLYQNLKFKIKDDRSEPFNMMFMLDSTN